MAYLRRYRPRGYRRRVFLKRRSPFFRRRRYGRARLGRY